MKIPLSKYYCTHVTSGLYHSGACTVKKNINIQWDLKSGLVWILNGRKEAVLQMFQISKGI